MTLIHDRLAPAPVAVSIVRRLARAVGARLQAVRERQATARAEAELRGMSERELHDIGLSRYDIPAAVRGALDHDATRRWR